MLVLEVVVDSELGSRRYVLEPSDPIHDQGVSPHRFLSVGDRELIFVPAVRSPVADWRPSAS